MYQIAIKSLINLHVIIQNTKKTLISNYRAYLGKKTKMIKMQHNSLYTIINELLDEILRKIKQVPLKKTKMTHSGMVLSQNKQS